MQPSVMGTGRSTQLSRTWALLAASALLGAAGCGSQGAPKGPPGPPPARVQLETVQIQPVREQADFLAEINSRRSVTLYPQVPGYVRAVLVKPGERVKQGAAIIQIDASTQQAGLSNLIALRNAREAALQNAQETYNRISKLAPAGVASQQELTQATAALEAARADLKAVEAQIQAQEVQVAYTRVTAPFDGVVGDIPVKVGDLIAPTTAITTLNQASAMEAYVRVPVALSSRITPQTIVQLLDARGEPLVESKVDFVSPDVKPDTQSVLVRSVFPNNEKLHFAQFVPARIIYGAHPGALVPVTSIVRRSGQTFVYVAEQDGDKLVGRQRPVTVGQVVDGRIEVLEGLKEGERIVASGVQKVNNGATLIPAGAGGQGGPGMGGPGGAVGAGGPGGGGGQATPGGSPGANGQGGPGTPGGPGGGTAGTSGARRGG